MAASQKVFVCGRCNEYGAPTLEELVTHMTDCGESVEKRKAEANDSEDEDDNDAMYDESENSDGAMEYADISEEKEPSEKQPTIDISYMPVQAEYHRPYVIDTGGRTSPTPFLWSRKTALILLSLLKSHREDMESPYIRKKTVWQKIAQEMTEKHGYCVTAMQCENKYKNMCNRYRKARNSTLETDRRLKNSVLMYNELHEFFKDDARFQTKSDSAQNSSPVPEIIAQIIPQAVPQVIPQIIHQVIPQVKPQVSPQIKAQITPIKPRTIAPKVIGSSTSKNTDSNKDCNGKEIITISESGNFKDSGRGETEPTWVRKMMETFERCHRENMQMQREFIDVLKKILEKK